jgi:hypothetical protein
MREIVAIFLVTQGCYWAGYTVRWLTTRQPKPKTLVFPEDLSPEFKAWLHDYIAVNLR